MFAKQEEQRQEAEGTAPPKGAPSAERQEATAAGKGTE